MTTAYAAAAIVITAYMGGAVVLLAKANTSTPEPYVGKHRK